MSQVDVIVLFGATGDLAKKLLFPALYRLEENEAIDQKIVGVALEAWDTGRFAEHVSAALGATSFDIDPVVEKRLLSRLEYVAGDYTKPETYRGLAASCASGTGYVHYLAIPPKMFETVVAGLGNVELLDGARLMIEKPFGRDLESARQLNGVLHRYLDETAIYRIDHFLGKEPVESLLAFRYANPVFDAVWSRHHIDHIQLTMAEAFDIAGRGALYESLGVVRDVVQNHLLQVVGLLTMEAPVTAEADSYADERAKVLKAMRTVAPADIVYGQYGGYRSADHVAADSPVATFAALSLAIDNPRWYGVPIYIRAGKAMATTATQAVVVFRDAPPLSFSTARADPEANRLVFRIGPTDGVDLLVQTKEPGDGLHLASTQLSVDYNTYFGRLPLAYERVLLEAIQGDRTQFARQDAVEEAWRVFDAVTDPASQPAPYEQGSWGPAEAAGVLAGGRQWIDPAPGGAA